MIINYKNQPKIKTIDFDFLKNTSVSFLHLSDLHIGIIKDNHFYEKIIDNIYEFLTHNKVDFIILNGDIFDSSCYLDLIYKFLFSFNELDIDIYYVFGNHEENDVLLFEKIINKNYLKNIKILKNSNIVVGNLNLIGLFKEKEYIDISNLLINNKRNIIVSHNPISYKYLEKEVSNIFILSGHTHGEQLRFIGRHKLLDKSKLSGFYKLNNNNILYISSGAGYGKIPIRFLTESVIEYFKHTL